MATFDVPGTAVCSTVIVGYVEPVAAGTGVAVAALLPIPLSVVPPGETPVAQTVPGSDR